MVKRKETAANGWTKPARDEQPAKKVHRMSKSEASAMEVMRIREMDSEGFGSGMLSMQTDAVLKSARAPYQRLKGFESALKALKEEMSTFKPKKVKPHGKVMTKVLGQFSQVEIRSDKSEEMVLNYVPPETFVLVGSYLTRCLLWSSETKSVDICVVIPRSCILQKDYLNYRYIDRRLLYLSALSVDLKKSRRWDDIQVGKDFVGGDRLRPVLSFRPTREVMREIGTTKEDLNDCMNITFRILPVVDDGLFPAEKMRPDRENVKMGKDVDNGLYNHALASDAAMVNHLKAIHDIQSHSSSYSDAVLLLKIWRGRRALPVTNFMMGALLAYLISNKTVPDKASVQHMFRACLQYFSSWNLPEERKPLSLLSTPYCNLFEHLTDAEMIETALNAKAALRTLEQSGAANDALGGAYASLFRPSQSVSLSEQYDAAVFIRRNGQSVRTHANELAKSCSGVITKALGKRCTLASPRLMSEGVFVGLKLSPDMAFGRVQSVEESGMTKDEFRAFWGNRSDLRRFKDGRILESVVWSTTGTASLKEAVQVALSIHIPEISADMVELYSHDWESILPKLDKDSLAARNAAEELGKALRNMEEVPLEVVSIAFWGELVLGTSVLGNSVGETRCRPSATLVLSFEASAKWPNDVEAVRASCTAFYVAMARSLRVKGFDARACKSSLEVDSNGYFFRVILRYDAVLPYIQSEKEREMQIWTTVRRPRLFNALRTVCGENENSAFQGTCRLGKRWLASHFLSNHFCDELIELIVARMFFKPDSLPLGSPPTSVSVGFACFLSLLSKFPWESAPLVIDFDGNGEIYEQAEKAFRSLPNRQHAPAMIVSTPGDILGSSFKGSGRSPERVVLRRVVQCAAAALAAMNDCYADGKVEHLDVKLLFRSRSDAFQESFLLKEAVVPLASARIDAKSGVSKRIRSGPLGYVGCSKLLKNLLLDFNPVEQIVYRLRDLFGDYALFFYDKYGGKRIGLVWRPSSLKLNKFSLYSLPFSRPLDADSGSTQLAIHRPNVVYAINRLLGDMLVDSNEEN